MAQMSMNKAIHGAFRRDLARFLDAFDRFSDGDTRRAADLGRAWQNFDTELDHHHHGEHEIAWPALRAVGVSDELITELDGEHEAMVTALEKARGAVKTFAVSATKGDADVAREAVASLQAVMETHMTHEEAEIEPVFLANEGSEPLKEMGRKFGRERSPMAAGRFFAWVSDGASPEETAAIKEQVPGPVLLLIGGLFGRGYRREVAPVWRA